VLFLLARVALNEDPEGPIERKGSESWWSGGLGGGEGVEDAGGDGGTEEENGEWEANHEEDDIS